MIFLRSGSQFFLGWGGGALRIGIGKGVRGTRIGQREELSQVRFSWQSQQNPQPTVQGAVKRTWVFRVVPNPGKGTGPLAPTPVNQSWDVAALERMRSSCLLKANPSKEFSCESVAAGTLGNKCLALKGDLGDFLRDSFIFEIWLHWKSFWL